VIREAKAGSELGDDWTGHYLDGPVSGDDYPWRDADGVPVLPYFMHHAERTGDRLWDAWGHVEIVNGSLALGVMDAFMMHTFATSSWPQRWASNAVPAGSAVGDTDVARRSEVVTDPATLLILETLREATPPQVGQWQPGGDVEAQQRVIDASATRLAQDAGVPPSDVQRLGGTARSGYAISVSNEGKRAAQRKFAPSFRDGDEQLVRLAAILLNRFGGEALPEGGYSIVYREIPLSPQELDARRKHALELMAAGLMGQVEAYRYLHPGVSEEQARQDLLKIQDSKMI